MQEAKALFHILLYVKAMRLLAFAAIALAAQAQHASGPYAPLWLYQGTWQVSHAGQAAGQKPELLTYQCAELGKDFACGQTANGEATGLVVYIAKGPNHYVTQTIMPDGRASGEVILDVNGPAYTYSSRRDAYGQTTFYRSINVFTGRNKIHYSIEHSADQKNWTVDSSGDEVKTR